MPKDPDRVDRDLYYACRSSGWSPDEISLDDVYISPEERHLEREGRSDENETEESEEDEDVCEDDNCVS